MTADWWVPASALNAAVLYGSGLLAAGTVVFRLAFRVRGLQGFLWRRVLLLAAIGAVSALLRPLLQTGMLVDEGLSGAFDAEMLSLVLEGPAGAVLICRLAGLGLLIVGAAMGLRRAPMRQERAWSCLLAALSASGVCLFLVSFLLAGHVSGQAPGLWRAALFIHLLGLSFWLGALWPLYRIASGPPEVWPAAEVARQFSAMAGVLVPLLLLSGAGLAWYLLGSAEALIFTEYGRLLLTKLMLVVAVLALAAVNKFRLVPAMTAGGDQAYRDFRLVIQLEVLVLAGILLLTGLMTNSVELPGA